MLSTKQAHDCRVGDIDHRGKAYLIRTTDLAGENPRFDTYDAPDEINIRGSQEALFQCL